MITKDNIIEELLKDHLIVQSFIYSNKSAKYWEIQSPITIKLSYGFIINIPKGFCYDMATVPKWLWSVIRPFNLGLFGYLIHDYLYIHQEKHNLSRKQVDQEMLYWTNITNSKHPFDNKFRYCIVRMVGWLWWKKLV